MQRAASCSGGMPRLQRLNDVNLTFKGGRACLATLLMVAGIGWPASAQVSDPVLAAGPWHVIEIDGAPATFDETILIDGDRASGKAACNRFAGNVHQAGSAIEFSAIATTRMFCAGRMDAEARFLGAMEAVKAFAITGSTISFSAGDGHVVIRARRAP